MNIQTLVIVIGAAAIVLTALIRYTSGKKINLPISFLQTFCGILFIISGFVKAVDPLGTAYKLDQYFAEFEVTFADTWFSFITPLFPFLGEYGTAFSVGMIVLEMVLGVMLIIGAKRKLAAWAFFLIVLFFFFLTGFTYLTGYVPPEGKFFAFGTWTEYDPNYMRVTDCGCFGDFIKLSPKTSFFKDVVLMVPSILFIIFHKRMHTLGRPNVRNLISVAAVIASLWYCLSNYVWNLPDIDFRPFKEGADIRTQKELEEEAMASVEVTGFKFTNKDTGKAVRMSLEEYYEKEASYPREEWDLEQITTKPSVEQTKISEFVVEDVEGNDMSEALLAEPGLSFMIVCHETPARSYAETRTVTDTIYRQDTLRVGTGNGDSILVRSVVDELRERDEQVVYYDWEQDWITDFRKVGAFLQQAKEDGLSGYAIVGGAGPDKIDALMEETDFPFPIYEADDILLKTIVRSNPGIVAIRDGVILRKWHKAKLPTYEEAKAKIIAK